MTEPAPLPRRRALGLIAAAGVALVVPGCSGSAVRRPRAARPSAGPRRTPLPPSAADWRSLSRRVTGDVLRAHDSGYDTARLLFDRRFDAVRPLAVLRVASEADIAQGLDFARSHGIGVRVRSGGHSYLGASVGRGLVIDLRRLAGVTVGATTATLGAGTALVDGYARLAAAGVSVPAGSCPTVGLSGLALGGGIGVVARRYGLTCDRLVAARVVTAAGDLLECDATHHPDLYWALRGGGGSFGVVTSMTLRTHPAEPLAHAFVSWPWSAAVQVAQAWQSWMADAPDTLWSTCHLLATSQPSGPPTVTVAAVYVGPESALGEQVGRLAQAVPATPGSRFVGSAGYEQTMMLEAGCASRSVAACHVGDEPSGGDLPRDTFVAGSDFFMRPVPPPVLARAVAAVEQRQVAPDLGVGGVALDSLGGTVDAPRRGDTAYVHRGALFSAQYTASWLPTSGGGSASRNRASLATMRGALAAAASGECYQNYADATLPRPQHAYYAENLPRLVEVRRAYDPADVFALPQGIPVR